MISKIFRPLTEPLRPWLVLVAAFFIVALVGRLMLIKLLFPEWSLSVWGLIGDLLASIFAASVLFLLRAIHPVAAAVWLVLWLVLLAANVEHLYALNEPLRLGNFQFSLDANFVRGSLLSLQTLPFIGFIFVFGVWVWCYLPALSKKPLALMLCVLFTISSAAVSVRVALSAPHWRQASPMVVMLTNVTAGIGDTHTAAVASDESNNFFIKDTSGARLAKAGSRETNVLLVVLEGLTGAYLKQNQEVTGFQSRLNMPKLSRIADDGIVTPHFVTHGVGTIGGLYAIYCGDYSQTPSDSESIKPFLFLDLPPENRPECLPQKLRQAGYSTSYLQAADLRYMKKSDFLPQIGFEHVAGKGDFADGDLANFWGAGDGDLLSAALVEIERLQTFDKPWFLSLLSVGTHHPYIAPEEYITAAKGDRKIASVRYLDDVLASFVNELKARGVLEDTLVIFTSDESHGVPGHPFGSHWGLFVALGDEVPRHLSEAVFGQVDVALSVLDYLEIDDNDGGDKGFLGRSIFRDNNAFRPLPFGRFVFATPGQVFSCKGGYCSSYEWEGAGLFSAAYQVSQFPAAAAESLSQKQLNLFARAGLFYGRGGNDIIFSLRDLFLPLEPEQPILNSYELSLPAKSRVEVILNVENTGAEAAHFYSFWKIAGDKIFSQPKVRLPSLAPAAGFELSYSFYNDDAKDASFYFSGQPHKGKTNAVIRKFKVSAISSKNHGFKVQKFEVYANNVTAMRDKNGNRIFADELEKIGLNGEGANFRVLFQTSNAGDAFMPPRYQIGELLDFSENGAWHNAFALATDWSLLESWGVWSSGDKPALVMHLGDIDRDAEYELRYKFIPYIKPPTLNSQTLTFYINGTKLGQQIYNSGDVREIGIEIPGRLFNPNALNSFAIGVKEPFTPRIYNIQDEAQTGLGLDIGLGLLTFRIDKK